MDEKSVDRLERDLGQVLVGPMDRVSRLEPDHALPAALGEDPPRHGRVASQLGELRLRSLEDRHAASEVVSLLSIQARDAWMSVIRRSEAELGLALLLVLISLLDHEGRDRATALVGEDDALAYRSGVDCQADGERPRQAACEVHLVDHTLVIRSSHEALER